MKNIIFLALILVIKATSVHAQTSFSEVPSFAGNVDDAGDTKIAQTNNQSVYKNQSTAKFNVATKSIKADFTNGATTAAIEKISQSNALDHKKSFANLSSPSNAKRNDVALVDAYTNNKQL